MLKEMTQPPDPVKSRLKKWGLIFPVLIGLWFLIVLGFPAFARYRLWSIQSDLDHTEPGWRWDQLEAAREAIPDKENSAVVVLSADLELELVDRKRLLLKAGVTRAAVSLRDCPRSIHRFATADDRVRGESHRLLRG